MLRTIVEESPKNMAIMDVFSKLCQERIIFIDEPIDSELANGVIAQMLYLDSLNNKEISIYINTPGGSVSQGLAIYDVSKLINSPIRTVAIGETASMGAILLLMGSTRCALKHTRIMFHQPFSIFSGKASDLKVEMKELEIYQDYIYSIVKENTKFEDPEKSFISDLWLSPEEALKYGVITKIL